MMLLRSVVICCVLVGMAPQSPSRDPVRKALADFPPGDWRAAGLHSQYLALKSAVGSENSPAAVEALFARNRVEQAFDGALRAVQRGDAASVEATLAIVARRSSLRDARAKDLVEAARARIPSFPRQAAARVARALVIPVDVGPPGWSERYVTQLRAFIQEYPGTEAALSTEVDILVLENENDDERTFAALDAFIARHPRSAAAARALRAKGFRLGQPHRQPPRGSDPTARFLRLMDVVDELDSGRYPASESANTLEIVLRFMPFEPSYAPDTLDRVIERYRTYAERHLDLDEQNPASNGVGYLLTGRLSPLFAQKGQEYEGVERVLVDVAQRAPDPFAVEYLRSEFYLRAAREAPAKSAVNYGDKARKLLEDIHARARGLYQRKSLATLATVQAQDGQLAAAKTSFERYLALFPTSDFAWVAALRLGQCLQAAGDTGGAVKAFNHAVTRYASIAPAQVLGHAYAARALESIGQLAPALAEYDAAYAKWDNEYGQDYSIGPATQTGDSAARIDSALVSRDALDRRISDLRLATSSQGATRLERARWLIANNRRPEATAVLDELARTGGAPSPEARELRHRIRLEDALVLAADPKRQTQALAALAALSREPFDFVIGASELTRASMLWTRGSNGLADAAMRQALDRLAASIGSGAPTAPSPVEQDVAAIRDLAFRPHGDGAFKGSTWESYALTDVRQPFLVVSSEVPVSFSDGKRERVRIQRPPSIAGAKVLSLTSEQLSILGRIMAVAGGTDTRERKDPMDPFYLPGPRAAKVGAFWNRFFPTQAGHWGGWVLETYPIVTTIEFADASRTRALAAVTIGYSGSTLLCEKRNGRWVAVGLQGFWVT